MAATRVTTATTTTTATRPPGFRRTHVRLLTELLLAALQDGDGDTALDILRVLARLQARLPELIWKVRPSCAHRTLDTLPAHSCSILRHSGRVAPAGRR